MGWRTAVLARTPAFFWKSRMEFSLKSLIPASPFGFVAVLFDFWKE